MTAITGRTTYRELTNLAARQVAAAATALTSERFADAASARANLEAYWRLLGAIHGHAWQLAGGTRRVEGITASTTPEPADRAAVRFIDTLARAARHSPDWDPAAATDGAGTSWLSAARALGTANDLLATHREAIDEVTLGLVAQASMAQVAEVVMTERLDVGASRALLDRLVEHGIQGRRAGEGFYTYPEGRRAGANPRVDELLSEGVGVAAGQAGERLLLAFVTECLLCWDDGTLCHPDDGDLAAVLGIGFPKHLGGPFHWVDRQGAEAVLLRCQQLGEDAFPPGDALPRLASTSGRFADEARRQLPGNV